MYALQGFERVAVEATGILPPELAPRLVPPGLTASDPLGVSLLIFEMRGLKPVVGGPGIDYHEALWRLDVRRQGQPAWLVLACHINRDLPRVASRWLIGYPTRRQSQLRLDTNHAPQWRAFVKEGHDCLDLRLTLAQDAVVPSSARPLLVFRRSLLEVPFDEGQPASARRARLLVDGDTISPVLFGAPIAWSEEAVAIEGRPHLCAPHVQLAGIGNRILRKLLKSRYLAAPSGATGTPDRCGLARSLATSKHPGR